ncbi:hypothetical protein [Deinococcus cavernae]|uniref:hypothetical protein n=1 Tax=Deinococcus cavernae TaxID=2320857 RepID=UPI0011C22B13|nr:hypothetical protein [Deinococcus cavernae]
MRRVEGVEVELNAAGRGVMFSLQFPHPDVVEVFRQALRAGELLEMLTPSGWRAVRVTAEDVQQGQGVHDILMFSVHAVGGACET